ncbi:MAG: hypothetical protein JNM12_10035 [Alphaproteobacteria bacterium]|nr:hypothetical protein [Alphaproteobacteria bacterium]
MIAVLFFVSFRHAPETTRFSSSRRSIVGATVQRLCNGGALHLMGLKGLGNLPTATVQR